MRVSTFFLVAAIGLAGCADTSVPVARKPVVTPVTPTTPVTPSTLDTPLTPDNPTTRAAPDNTGVNKRDADGSTLTPLDQNENTTDIKITADIRKRVLAAENMSTNAQNAKIITADGKVTLRGPVASAEEKDELGKIALSIAGDGNVTNLLEVAP